MVRWGERGWTSSWWRRVAGKSMWQRGMEEAPENGKELPHSARANGMNVIWQSDTTFDCILYIYIYMIFKRWRRLHRSTFLFMPSSGCNLLFVKLYDVSRYLNKLYNFTSNFIFCVLFCYILTYYKNLCKRDLVLNNSVNCILKYPRVTTWRWHKRRKPKHVFIS